MTFTIGRASLAAGPAVIRHVGDDLEWEFDIDSETTSASLVHAQVLRQQLLGLVDNDDEPAVPVTWDDDSDFDGFYWVRNVTIDPVTTYLDHGLMRCMVQLRRVGGGFAEPFFEQVAIGVKRTTGSADGLAFAVHNGVRSRFADSVITEYERMSEDGTVFVYSSTTSTSGSTTVIRFSLTPDDYYKSSAKLEVTRDGTWYPIVGRQVPSIDDVTGNWRLTNGLVRVFPSATLGALDFEVYDPQGAAWVSVATFKHGYNDTFGDVEEYGFGVNTQVDGAGDPTFDAEIPPAVIRNGPDLVAIQFDTLGYGLQTLSIRQGAYHVELNPNSASARAVWFATTTATSTTDDSGIVETTADGNGNRAIIAAAAENADLNRNNTDGILETDDPNIPFMMGVCINNSASSDFNGFDDVENQFVAPFSMRRQVVAR